MLTSPTNVAVSNRKFDLACVLLMLTLLFGFRYRFTKRIYNHAPKRCKAIRRSVY